MPIGYNHDIRYKQRMVHVQTEDRAPRQLCVESHIFLDGRVLDSRVRHYADEVQGLDELAREAHARALMQQCHRELARRLVAGDYDHLLA